MKKSYKAALLSAFVFPGVGQLYLKTYWRGLAIILCITAGLCYIISSAVSSAMTIIDDAVNKLQGGAANVQDISHLAGSAIVNTDPYYNALIYITACIWIFAVIDAYLIGKKRDSLNTEISPK